MKYSIILADPPWRYRVYYKSDAAHGAAESHYPTLTTSELKAVPVPELAAENCALFLWVTDPLIPEGLEVMKAWGFRYVTVAFYWAKQNKNGSPWFGLGHYTRGNPEQCLFGLKGRLERKHKGIPKLIISRRREHSRKPDEQYERIEKLFGEQKRIELFARQKWPGWDAWGRDLKHEQNYFDWAAST